jgi:hypothetical protein
MILRSIRARKVALKSSVGAQQNKHGGSDVAGKAPIDFERRFGAKSSHGALAAAMQVRTF